MLVQTLGRLLTYVLLFFVGFVLFSNCAKTQTTTYTDRIDPLLSLPVSDADPTIYQPFGMVQLSPITELDANNTFLAGSYNPAIKQFQGFEHFNLLRKSANASHPDLRIGYTLASSQNEAAIFDKSTELAAVGRYAVLSEFPSNKKSVRTEASIGQFTSLIEFIFPENEQAKIGLQVLSLPNTAWMINRADSFYVKISVLDKNQPLHSLVRFSMFPDRVTIGSKSLAIGDTLLLNSSDESKVNVHYQTLDKRKQVLVNTGFSRINPDRAESNFEVDSQGWWLEGMVAKAKLAWRTHLSKFTIIGGSISDQIKFFTLHYRMLRSLSLLTESAGLYPKVDITTVGKDLNTDKYAWYGNSPSSATLFWLRSTEAVPIKQMGADYQDASLRLAQPTEFYNLAILVEELENEKVALLESAPDYYQGVAEQLLKLSGLSIDYQNLDKVSFVGLPFGSFRMHLGGNAYYQRTEINASNTSSSSLPLLPWFDNGFTF